MVMKENKKKEKDINEVEEVLIQDQGYLKISWKILKKKIISILNKI